MGFIPEITCRHCGRKFSRLKKRCPYCGTTWSPDGKVPPQQPKPSTKPSATAKTVSKKPAGVVASLFQSNVKWQFLFGCVLVLLVIVAVIVLITASLGKSDTVNPVETPNLPQVEVTTPPPTPVITPSPVPTIPVASVSVTFLGSPIHEFTQRVGDAPIQLKAEIYPVEAVSTAKLEWRSSDESIVTVDGTGAVTAVGPGWAEVIAECGGVATSCKVWVPET